MRRIVEKKPRGPAVVSRVLEVTLEELGRVGLARLSLPRVAELAGINKTSLYRRWPTTRALVAAALKLAVPGEGELPDHGSLELDLVDLTRTLAAFIASPAGMGVIRTVFADGGTPQTRRRLQSMWGAPGQAAPSLVLQRAVERGELHPGADLDLLLHTIGGAVLQRIFVERKSVDAAWTRRLIGLLTQGVSPGLNRRGSTMIYLGAKG